MTVDIDELEEEITEDEARAASIAFGRELLGEKQLRAGQIKVTSEPLTYHRHSRNSYFRDLFLTDRVRGAEDRLNRHRMEMDQLTKERDRRAWRSLHSGGFEYRIEPNRTDGQGGYFAPPLWLNELFATAKRHGRVLSALIPGSFELPSGVSSINLPIIGNGNRNQQTVDISAVPQADMTDSAGSSLCVTFSGDADVAVQMLEQSPAGAMVDWVVMTDLTESRDAHLEDQILYGLGTSFQQLPGVVPNASVKLTYTDPSPTGSEMWPLLSQAAAQLSDLRDLPPEIWLMRSARWFWLNGQESTSGYPFGISPAFLGHDDDSTPWPIGGIMGVPVFLDDAVSATLSTNQDEIICMRPSDLVFLESAPQVSIYREPGSGNLSGRVQMHNYAAAITRYSSGIATIGGTGFAVQSGY